jgi:hypothetical protein
MLDRVRALAEALPEVEVEEEGRHAGFSVRGKRFAWYLEDHHGDGRIAINAKAPPGVNGELADRDPERFFIPPYLGPRGWAGMWLDTPDVDWDEAERLLVEAYRLTAPKKLVAQLDA